MGRPEAMLRLGNGQELPVLTDAQVVRLAQLARRIEAHFGRPQDIPWCLFDDDLQIVQSRPITTLFSIPAAADRENHFDVSAGLRHMMTNPTGGYSWLTPASWIDRRSVGVNQMGASVL